MFIFYQNRKSLKLSLKSLCDKSLKEKNVRWTNTLSVWADHRGIWPFFPKTLSKDCKFAYITERFLLTNRIQTFFAIANNHLRSFAITPLNLGLQQKWCTPWQSAVLKFFFIYLLSAQKHAKNFWWFSILSFLNKFKNTPPIIQKVV